ncbi:MAG: hypothetical protein WC840_03785 [Candidatus Peribacteraceae bacterium]
MNSARDTHGTFLQNLGEVLLGYLKDIDYQYALCHKHEKTTAIHRKGKELQVYRMYQSSGKLAEHLHKAVAKLPGWEESAYWEINNKSWEKIRKEVENRVEQHSSQFHVSCRGVLWESTPILVHAYKFDADKYLKIELILPEYKSPLQILPLKRITAAIECHEFLVPELIAKPKPPYAGHETDFLTLTEYLSRTMPPELYATRRFPLHRVNDSS